ncbi:MAG: hypothetical protein EXQ79_07790 [Acidimicrobiia bacterium]|nr:hypothetical protein [Acidimicrobiia bacterium]
MSIPPPPPRRRAPDPAAASTPSPPPPDPVARAARRAQSKRRAPRSRLLLAGVVLVAVALVAVGVVVVSGGGNDTASLDKGTTVQLALGDLSVESVNPFEAEFPPDASKAALALIETYVHDATIEPLRTGAVTDAALAEIFDDAALAQLATADRAVLLDEGLPKAIGKVTVEGIPIELTVLKDANKNLMLISATIDIEIKAQSKKGLVTIHRTGALVLIPQLDATWKITAWTLHVERGGPGVVATPTDATTTTTILVAP